MKSIIYLALIATLALTSCGEKNSTPETDGFEAAYPAMYTELGLPQYRRGTVQSVTGKNEGVKTTHNVIIMSDDTPSFVRDFFAPNMEKLGWKDTQARRRLSDIHEDDLYFAKYVKGRNKLEISSSAEGLKGSRTRISLAVFGSN